MPPRRTTDRWWWPVPVPDWAWHGCPPRLFRLPRATEGGHLDFAPNNGRELALLRWLSERYGHVSYERILSGDGLLDTYRFFAGAADGGDACADQGAGRQGRRTRGDAIRLFVDVFAGYAGGTWRWRSTPALASILRGDSPRKRADWFDPTAFAIAFATRAAWPTSYDEFRFFVTRQDTIFYQQGEKILKKELQGRAT